MKRQGFTLIELLAVIVILAIIALIATPTILGVIEKARKESAEQSALGYIDAVEKQILIGEVNENKIPYEIKSMYTVAELTDTYRVMVKGEKPKKGNICIDKKGNVEQYSIVVNDYVISNTTTQKKIIKGSELIEIKCGIYISSVDDLIQLGNEVNAGDNKSGQVYYLMNDIDLGGKFDENGNQISGGTVWTPIGTSSTPFSGVFDGNGHVISNMYVHTEGSAALFGCIKNSEVKNLGIVNSYIISTNNGAASIVGTANSSKISSCYNTSIISGRKITAGIVAFMGSSTIENCYNAGIVNSNEEQFAAGITGYISSDSIIKNCYNSGTILGNSNAGGIVGGSRGTTESCFNIGNVNGNAYSGGIVGQAYLSPKISNSYNTGNIANGTAGGIIGGAYLPEGSVVKNNYYLEGVSKYGIYELSSNSGAEPLSKEKMPDVLSVINHDGAFKEDTNYINNGNPILNWQ